MSLLNDVARCAGNWSLVRADFFLPPVKAYSNQCRDCLCRTSPGDAHTPRMPPPDFVDGVCPSRIAPHD
jgi:hypothetical protein